MKYEANHNEAKKEVRKQYLNKLSLSSSRSSVFDIWTFTAGFIDSRKMKNGNPSTTPL